MRFLLIIVILTGALSCADNQGQETPGVVSVGKDSSRAISPDSSEMPSPKAAVKADEYYDDEINPQIEARAALISKYTNPTIVDSAFENGGLKYHAYLKHYCTMDSAILVPASSNFDTKKDFITHNFKSRFILTRGKDTITNTEIDKSMFYRLDLPSSKGNCALYFNDMRVKEDTIEIGYNIGIPATDVAALFVIKFDLDGKYYVGQH